MTPKKVTATDPFFFRIFASRKPVSVILMILLLMSALVVSIANLRILFVFFDSPHIYRKDFIQEFVLARAGLLGLDPYLSAFDWEAIFREPIPMSVWHHPTPHPPPVVLFSLPLAFLGYQQAGLLWFFMECILLFITLFLLLRWLEIGQTWRYTILAFFLVFGWQPLLSELANGQFGIILLLVCTGIWLSFTHNHKILAGVLLGISISAKLFAWPVLLFFALRRDWRFIFPACLTFIFLNFAAGLLIGWDQLVYYYTVVGGQVSNIYRACSNNFSLFSIGWRIFDGTRSPVLAMEADPLISSSIAATLTAYFLPLSFLLFILVLVTKIKNIDVAFAVLFSASLLVNPVAWQYYLVIAILPTVILGRYLIQPNISRLSLLLYLIALVLLYFPQSVRDRLIYIISGTGPPVDVPVQVPFWTSLITLSPILPISALIWLGWRLRFAEPIRNESPRELTPQN